MNFLKARLYFDLSYINRKVALSGVTNDFLLEPEASVTLGKMSRPKNITSRWLECAGSVFAEIQHCL